MTTTGGGYLFNPPATFSFIAGTNYFTEPGFTLNNRTGWSSADVMGAYGSLVSGDLADAGTLIADCYYNASDGTLNVTFGVYVGPLPLTNFIGGLDNTSLYNSGTTYTPGQVVFYETGPNNGMDFYGATFYECIQGGTGQSPPSSPAYWAPVSVVLWSNHGPLLEEPAPWNNFRALGPYPDQQGVLVPTPPQWSASTTYYAGCYVADSSNHTYYCQAAGSTTGNTPVPGENTAYWTDVSLNVGGLGLGYNLLELRSVTIAGLGTFVTQYGSNFVNANPLGSTFSAETENGPGFVRYTWPMAASPFVAGQSYTVTLT